MERTKRLYGTLIQLCLLALFGVGMLSRCASISAPKGGPRDTLPPRIVTMTPAFGTTNFKGKRINIEFDEYVQLKELQKQFFVSPFMKKKPSVALRGRGIQVDILDTLAPDQTYAFNFGKSVMDNNEGNPYTGLRYVFSTGATVDSLIMSGYTVDAMKGDSASNVYVLFYDAKVDSIPAYDSTLFKSRPVSVARSFGNGIFIAENLKPIDYRIYALEDNNNNTTYEPGVDRVAFLDTTYNPERQEPFNVWYDTTRRYLQADPQIQLRVFMDNVPRDQGFAGSKREKANRVLLAFRSPRPKIKEIVFDGIDSSKIITEYMTSKRDSIILWFNATKAQMPDTLRGHMIATVNDSLHREVLDTLKFKMPWHEPVKKEDKKKKNDTLPEQNPFRVQVAGGTTLNPEKKIEFEFDYPLVHCDTLAMKLEKLDQQSGAVGASAPFTFRRDTLHIRRWTFDAKWTPGQKYRLTVPSGAFVNTNGESNDTLKSEFTVDMPEKYASLVLKINGKTPESEYIVEVVSGGEGGRGGGGNVLRTVQHVRTGVDTLHYIEPGSVKLRITEDKNANGRWDAGQLIRRIQPERVELFVNDDGEESILTKENWEVELAIDMNRLFGPVTMQQMSDKLRRDNEAYLKELAKKRAEDAKRKKKSEAHQSSGGMGGMGGMGGGVGMGGMGGMLNR